MKTSEEIMKSDLHPPNCHLVIGDGPCTCRIGRWHDQVAQLEDRVAIARRFLKGEATLSALQEALGGER